MIDPTQGDSEKLDLSCHFQRRDDDLLMDHPSRSARFPIGEQEFEEREDGPREHNFPKYLTEDKKVDYFGIPYRIAVRRCPPLEETLSEISLESSTTSPKKEAGKCATYSVTDPEDDWPSDEEGGHRSQGSETTMLLANSRAPGIVMRRERSTKVGCSDLAMTREARLRRLRIMRTSRNTDCSQFSRYEV